MSILKQCTVTAKDSLGNTRQVKINVFTSSIENIEIDYLKSPFFHEIQEAFKTLDKILKDVTGRSIEIRFLYGKIAYNASFKEDSASTLAFFGYDFAAGLNPLFGIKLKQEFGLSRIIPAPIKKWADFLKFEMAVGGEWNLNGHYAKTGPHETKPSLNSELRVLLEFSGGVELTKSLFGNDEYKVIDAKLGTTTGVTGEFGPLSNKRGLGITAKIKFDGIKLSGYISALDGLFTYKKDIVFVEEKILLPEKELYIISENSTESNSTTPTA